MNENEAKEPRSSGRYARVLPVGQDYFVHVISRVVNREFVLGDQEKAHFRKLMRRLAEFSGLEIVTYVIMDNHFHLLLQVPRPEALSDEEIARRIRLCSGRMAATEYLQMVERLTRQGGKNSATANDFRAQYTDRMYDLGAFMKALKQQFTRWFNKRHERKGTLWEARYKSVVIDGEGLTDAGSSMLMTVAAYIDLNPVRAGMVFDPVDYPWCGYAEAVAGHKPARKGLKAIASALGRSTDWRMVRRSYRKLLFGAGEEQGLSEAAEPIRKGFKREAVVKVWEENGELTSQEILRCRVRYFSDAVALGSAAFVAQVFDAKREAFGQKRERGPRKIRGSGLSGIYGLRDLQVDVVT